MSTKVVTGKARLSYEHLFEAHGFEGQTPKYSAMLLIPKEDEKTIEKLRNAEEVALEQGKSSKFNGKVPKAWKSIIRDGDEVADEYPEREGHWFMTVSSVRPPIVVDRNKEPVLDRSEVYSGCYVRASLNAFPYSVSGNKGVSFGLNHVQKLAEGEPFGSVDSVEDVFDDLDDDDLI